MAWWRRRTQLLPQVEVRLPEAAHDAECVRRAAVLTQWTRSTRRGHHAHYFGRHSPEAIDSEPARAGRRGQPLGRHSPEYHGSLAEQVGMYPMGGARRVSPSIDNYTRDGVDES